MPHPLPYQGSKRKQASTICQYFPDKVETLFEPFCGSAALTIYAAERKLARHFVLGDKCAPIVDLWEQIIERPKNAARRYRELWTGQDGSYDYFQAIRSEFNETRDPLLFHFLAARCVANAIRFNAKGEFTQSQDKRRLGTHPDRMERDIYSSSQLLRGKTTFFRGEFVDCTANATSKDLVYMDPPYQGTSEGRDNRYFASLERTLLEKALDDLNERNVPFLLSYDGMHGDKTYGVDLPRRLKLAKILIKTGRSTQGTLNGREVVTQEALYSSWQLTPLVRGQIAMTI